MTAAGNLAIATYRLQIAFNEFVAGVFTLNSAIDGPDTLTDVGVFSGTFDDVTDDVDDSGYELVFGTDNLMSAIQPASLTVTLARVDDPGFWNPANPSSPLNSLTPGLDTPMRPVKLTATAPDNSETVLFRGFLCRANWNAASRSCEIYCEDLLRRAARVYPTIASTGRIYVGDLVKLLFDAVDPLITCDCDNGTLLDDFTADASQSVTQILTTILSIDLGTVYIRGAGTPVYRANSTPLAAASLATIAVTEQMSDESTGIDIDDIGTRITVEKTDSDGNVVGTWTSISPFYERKLGESAIPQISSPYFPMNGGQGLADELTKQGIDGKPPMSFTLANVDDVTLALIFGSEPMGVYTVQDDLGGSSGDGIAQQISHTIQTGFHQAVFLMKQRKSLAFTLVSEIDGTDTLRYP